MCYNVGPDFTRRAPDLYTCDDCGEIVKPEWNGFEGDWRCPECYADLPDFVEGE